MFSGVIPPSTSRMIRGAIRSIISLAFWIFGIMLLMNFCPPNPGLTVIIRSRSTSGRISSTRARGVAGLMETPGLIPFSRIWDRVRCRWREASAWIVRKSLPAAANAPM
jgi:hypothetical protein